MYEGLIPAQTTSIGIVTHLNSHMGDHSSNYWKTMHEKGDKKTRMQIACAALTHSLREYLEKMRPSAKVTIHGTESEERSYARLSGAKIAICGTSTFCIWPSIIAKTSYLSTQFWPKKSFKGNIKEIPNFKTYRNGKGFLTSWEIASDSKYSARHEGRPCDDCNTAHRAGHRVNYVTPWGSHVSGATGWCYYSGKMCHIGTLNIHAIIAELEGHPSAV